MKSREFPNLAQVLRINDAQAIVVEENKKVEIKELITFLNLVETFTTVSDSFMADNEKDYLVLIDEVLETLSQDPVSLSKIEDIKLFLDKATPIDNSARIIIEDMHEAELIDEVSKFSGYLGQEIISELERVVKNILKIELSISNINKIKEIMEELEDAELSEDMIENMIKLNGQKFKKLLSLSEVSYISGYIIGVTDRSLKVRSYQAIELNHMNKIRPPVSVIKDDTVIYIEEIAFSMKSNGRELDEADLQAILEFID